MNDYPYTPTFKIADGTIPVDVCIESPTEVRVIRWKNQDGLERAQVWTFDSDLKPVSFDYNNRQFVYDTTNPSDIKAFELRASGKKCLSPLKQEGLIYCQKSWAISQKFPQGVTFQKILLKKFLQLVAHLVLMPQTEMCHRDN